MSDGARTLGTAGHIDHGKTALVQALTGVDTDRLPQERERGISIELGFARLDLPSGRTLSVVDVPGHERFVRTMVAGATGIDLFLAVVAADDGVMPQTREHLAVLELLEVPAGVVALTKSDLVSAERLESARAEVDALLRQGPYAGTPIVPVSVVRGSGLGELRAALDACAGALGARGALDGPARLHVDRSFTLQGVGTVVTGTLWSGSVARGQEVRIEPRGLRARVRSVEVHGEGRPVAAAGSRVALNLARIERDDVRRGDVVVAGTHVPGPSYLLDVTAHLARGAPALQRGARVQVHHGTREVPARVAPIDSGELEPGAEALVQLRLEQPLMAVAGDRFVLRSIAPADTIGGGRVLDPDARKHGPGQTHVRRLHALAAHDPLELLRIELEGARSGVVQGDHPGGIDRLAARGEAVPAGELPRRWFTPALLERAQQDLLEAVESNEDVRPRSVSALAHSAGLDADGAAAVLETLAARGDVERAGGGYVAAGGAAVAEDPRARELEAALAQDGLEPRKANVLAAEAGMEAEDATALLDRLAREGRVVRVGPGLYYHPEALARTREVVVSICEQDGAVTIAGLRDRLGTSRKFAQALLEHFDAARLTRRVGDEHVLRRAR